MLFHGLREAAGKFLIPSYQFDEFGEARLECLVGRITSYPELFVSQVELAFGQRKFPWETLHTEGFTAAHKIVLL